MDVDPAFGYIIAMFFCCFQLILFQSTLWRTIDKTAAEEHLSSVALHHSATSRNFSYISCGQVVSANQSVNEWLWLFSCQICYVTFYDGVSKCFLYQRVGYKWISIMHVYMFFPVIMSLVTLSICTATDSRIFWSTCCCCCCCCY